MKNRATINEKEEGWDDVEWLQGMVTRLRTELKAIKEGAVLTGEPNPRAVGNVPLLCAMCEIIEKRCISELHMTNLP